MVYIDMALHGLYLVILLLVPAGTCILAENIQRCQTVAMFSTPILQRVVGVHGKNHVINFYDTIGMHIVITRFESCSTTYKTANNR